jgi:hypothetical protein
MRPHLPGEPADDGASEFSARDCDGCGENPIRLWWRAIDKTRRIFAEGFETMSTTEEVRLAVVCERTGSRVWVYGHAADGIDCVCVRGRCLLTLNRMHLTKFHYASIAMELKLA